MIAMAGFSFSFGASTGKYVAVLETATEDTTVLSRSELQHLTDKLRSEAVKELPAEQGFTIMTRENIEAMLPPSKGLAECEGSCLVETGKNISADYVAQGRAGRFGKKLTLTVELYETAGAKLLGSMSVESPDADGLLDAIEKNSAPLFSKIKATSSSFPSGISGISYGNSGNGGLALPQQYIVNIITNPAGASVNMDDIPLNGCSRTPCKVEISAGEHHFVASLREYEDADSLVAITGKDQEIKFDLHANFGILSLSPKLIAGIGDTNDLDMRVDGRPVNRRENHLNPGRHEISIHHKCYEDVSFNLIIAQNKTESFMDSLKPRHGGLILSAIQNGVPMESAVYINGFRKGTTPWSGELPICSHVEIGENRIPVDAALQEGSTVRYTQTLGDEPDRQSVDSSPASSPAEIPTPSALAAETEESTSNASMYEMAATPETKDESMSTARKWAVTLWVSSAVSLGSGLFFNYQGQRFVDNYNEALAAKNHSDAKDAYDDLQTSNKLRATSYGVAAGAFVLGCVLWILGG